VTTEQAPAPDPLQPGAGVVPVAEQAFGAPVDRWRFRIYLDPETVKAEALMRGVLMVALTEARGRATRAGFYSSDKEGAATVELVPVYRVELAVSVCAGCGGSVAVCESARVKCCPDCTHGRVEQRWMDAASATPYRNTDPDNPDAFAAFVSFSVVRETDLQEVAARVVAEGGPLPVAEVLANIHALLHDVLADDTPTIQAGPEEANTA
jgi:hypothetical protein